MAPKRNTPWTNPNFDPDKAVLYTHDPFMQTFPGGIKAECDANGKLTISQEHEGGEFDELVLSASVIYKLAVRLYETRHSKLVDRQEIRDKLAEKD